MDLQRNKPVVDIKEHKPLYQDFHKDSMNTVLLHGAKSVKEN